MVNVQIRGEGFSEWFSFGDVALVDAAKQYVLDICEDSDDQWIVNRGEVWQLEARYEHAPETIWKLTLQPRVVADVVQSRGGE